jgi:hypothetical protein
VEHRLNARARFLAAVLALPACGGGPRLTNLRCRASPCQDKEDPFRVHLAVDFSDDTGTFGAGALELRLNGTTQATLLVSDLIAAQQTPKDARAGTLLLDDELLLDRVTQNQGFRVSMLAHNGKGQGSNEPELSFNLHLGSFDAKGGER